MKKETWYASGLAIFTPEYLSGILTGIGFGMLVGGAALMGWDAHGPRWFTLAALGCFTAGPAWARSARRKKLQPGGHAVPGV